MRTPPAVLIAGHWNFTDPALAVNGPHVSTDGRQCEPPIPSELGAAFALKDMHIR